MAVSERPDLLGAADDHLFEIALEERRAVVTYDLAGFRALATEQMIEERHHFGIVLLHPEPFPQGERYLGRLISALDALLTAMPAVDALLDQEWWPDQ